MKNTKIASRPVINAWREEHVTRLQRDVSDLPAEILAATVKCQHDETKPLAEVRLDQRVAN